MKVTTLPMTGAAAIGPIPRLLAERVGDRAVDRTFQKARLPLTALESPRTPIPLQGLTDLWEFSSHEIGMRTFGFEVGYDMTPSTYGLWAEYCAKAETLGDGLDRLGRCLRFHQIGARFAFHVENDLGIVRYHPAWPGQYAQHSDHVVGSLIRLIQSFLGVDWHPVWAEFDYARDTEWRQLERVLRAPLYFGRPTAGVAIALPDLSHAPQTPSHRIVTLGDVTAEAAVALTPEPLRSAYNVIAFRLLDGFTDIDGAAKMCGVGVQGFQRRLRRAGLTYREVLSRARHQRAEALLRETSLPIAEIAAELGYEDHANFTRAFTKWAGHPPSSLRSPSR